MFDYNKSQIYNIYCNDTNIKKHYIGGTNSFPYRKRAHKYSCNNEKSNIYNIPLYQFIRSNGGWNNFSFEILEEYKCNNKQELLQREEHWMQKYNFDNLLNCIRAKITIEEQRKINKQYKIDNAIPIKEYKKKYRIDNAVPIKEKNKIYYLNNIEAKREYNRQYRIDNAILLKEKRKKSQKCECGGKYRSDNKKRHFNTDKHKRYEKLKINKTI